MTSTSIPTKILFGSSRRWTSPDLTMMCSSRVRYGSLVLHHYAWASEWFKVNLTTDAAGRVVETPPTDGVPAFAFNIDIATPMERAEREVFAVDLLADVLVRSDGQTYEVGDLNEMRSALAAGLISASELAEAERALARVVELVEQGVLLPVLEDAWPLEPAWPQEAPRMQRVPLSEVARLLPGARSSW